jgi:hypothetical protein
VKHVFELAQIELDRSFQIRYRSPPPRFMIFLGKLAHPNQNVDEADKPVLAKQLGRHFVHPRNQLSAIHRPPSTSTKNNSKLTSHALDASTMADPAIQKKPEAPAKVQFQGRGVRP